MAELTTTQKLAEARTAYHKLLTGSLRVVLRDGDSTVEYTPAKKGELLGYIGELENLLAKESGAVKTTRAPAGVIF